jgi:hypothetical protein
MTYMLADVVKAAVDVVCECDDDKLYTFLTS